MLNAIKAEKSLESVNFLHKHISRHKIATQAISSLSNTKYPEETNLPAIYSLNSLNGRHGRPIIAYLVTAVSLLDCCHNVVATAGLCSLPMFFQRFHHIIDLLLATIRVHHELFISRDVKPQHFP